MRSEIGIDVAASSAVVFDLTRDVTRWPTLLPHYRQVTVHSRKDGRVRATFKAIRPIWRTGLPVWWRSEQWADDSNREDMQLRFSHVAGATRGMEVTWHIRPTAEGCHVTIEHDFSRPLPLLGANFYPHVVDRFFVRPIAGRTLATFRQLAESAPVST